MKKFKMLYLVAFMLMLAAGTKLFSQNKIMFLGRETLGTHQADQDLVDKLTSWGYTVDYVTALPEAVSGYDGYTGLFIDETIGSSACNSFSTNGYPVPCINLEGWAVLSNRWGGWVKDASDTDPKTDWNQKSGAGTDGQSIVIRDNKHYITSSFEVGETVQWTNSTVTTTVENTNPVSFKEVDQPFSARLAQTKSFTDDGFYTMVTVDSLGAVPNRLFVWGMVAAGIEGLTPFTEHSATEDFFRIIEKATDWAYKGKDLPVGMDPVTRDLSVDIFPNPADNDMNIRFYSSVSDKNVKLSLNTISGKELEILAERQTKNGYNFVTFNTSHLAKGLYIIKLETIDKTISQKVIIQ